MQTIPNTFCFPDIFVSGAEASLFNIPLNKVQEVYKNRSENVTTELLLEKWNDNKEIDIEKLENIVNTAAHFVVDLPLRSRI